MNQFLSITGKPVTTRQRDFVVSHVIRKPKGRATVPNSRRKFSLEFYFTVKGTKIRVCKTFFCQTLAIGVKLVRYALEQCTGHGFGTHDRRGRHPPANKIPAANLDYITQHIRSFPALESHYSRQSTTKRYLGADLNIPKMYELYKTEMNVKGLKPEKIGKYRQLFKCEGLAFHKPKRDVCKFCIRFENLPSPTDEDIADHQGHLDRKKQAREQKEADKNESVADETMKTVCFDLEQVLPAPCTNASTLFYKRKLSCYNLSVYDMATKDAALYMWHEAVAGRGSSEIASCVYNYLCELPQHVTSVTMYSDTCGGQNRNVNFSAMCLYAVTHIPHLERIDQKFMESGHSHMEVDSVHSAIERVKKTGPIYAPSQWYTAARMARRARPYMVKEMQSSDFLNFKDIAVKCIKNRTKDYSGSVVQWLKIKHLCYVKHISNLVLFKYDLNSPEFKTLDISQTRGKVTSVVNASVQPLYRCTKPPSISTAKYNDLQDLCKSFCIKEEYHAFYKSLPHSGSVRDTLPEPDVDEDSE